MMIILPRIINNETFDYEPATEESILNRAKAGTTCLEYAYDHITIKNKSGVIWNGNNVTEFYEGHENFSSPYIVQASQMQVRT